MHNMSSILDYDDISLFNMPWGCGTMPWGGETLPWSGGTMPWGGGTMPWSSWGSTIGPHWGWDSPWGWIF